MESSEVKLKETTAPLHPDLLKEYISNMTDTINRKPLYVIDHDNSLVKEEFLLNYIGNLRLCVLIKETTPIASKIALLKAYLTSRLAQAANNIASEVAAMLLTMKGLGMPRGFLTVEERALFISENVDVLKEWEKFLSSVPYMAPFVFNYYRETIGASLLETGDVKLIDNPLLVSPNVLNLFFIPDFIETYLSRVDAPLPRFYKHLFLNPCFERMSLIQILQEQTSLLPFLHSLEGLSAAKSDTTNAVQL